jgi:hypothetical protein
MSHTEQDAMEAALQLCNWVVRGWNLARVNGYTNQYFYEF